MEESAMEGQQNDSQSKCCLVFGLHFALLSNLRSRYGHYPSINMAFHYSHEGRLVCVVKATAASEKKQFSIFTCVAQAIPVNVLVPMISENQICISSIFHNTQFSVFQVKIGNWNQQPTAITMPETRQILSTNPFMCYHLKASICQ